VFRLSPNTSPSHGNVGGLAFSLKKEEIFEKVEAFL
jgi:hypothetical protein